MQVVRSAPVGAASGAFDGHFPERSGLCAAERDTSEYCCIPPCAIFADQSYLSSLDQRGQADPTEQKYKKRRPPKGTAKFDGRDKPYLL